MALKYLIGCPVRGITQWGHKVLMRVDSSLLLPRANGAAWTGRLRNVWLKTTGQVGHRRKDDRSIRMVMVYSALVSAAANAGLAYAVFKMNLLHPLFALMEDYSNFEDKLTVVGIAMLFTMLFLALFYTAKVTKLLNDVKQLAAERDKALERRSQIQRLEALGVMAAGISHEINSSLQAVLASCEQAKAHVGTPEECLRILERAIENGLHAKRVTSNVLVFSRQSNAMSLLAVEMARVMEEAMEFSRAFLPETVDVKMVVEGGTMRLAIDRTAFIQVVSNLVNNAAHAMGFLGVVQITAGRVKLGAVEAKALEVVPGRYGRIEIADSGKGIEKEHLARIFDPFFTTKPAGEGNGLGLSIVHGLVKGMKGSITVSSEVGKGTRFTLLLPEAKEN